MKAHVFSGIDNIDIVHEKLQGKRIGLMTNPTGVDHDLRSTIDIIHERYHLTALYAVEHGIRGEAQAGAKVGTTVDPSTGVTVFSAYGKNDHFNEEMLDAFDAFVFDMQEVGARFYTYLYSLSYAMEACAKAGKPIVVLDRINPIGGIKRGGTVLDLAFRSFVGDHELPTQYGMTIGEYAHYVKAHLKLNVDLTVVPLTGWHREFYLDDTDIPWVAPSPNCPDLAAALCFVGTCIFEGTNLSEGRGTTQPFQVIGAPWIDGEKLEKKMNGLGLPGVRYRRASFCPTFSKHQGEVCHGVQMHVVDRAGYDAFTDGILLMDTVREMYPDQFSFIRWGEAEIYALDKLLGTDAYRTGKLSALDMIKFYAEPVRDFGEKIRPYLLY